MFAGSIVMHLRDQLLALKRIANLLAPCDLYVSAGEYDRVTGMLRFTAVRYFADRDSSVVFWLPSIRAWKRLTWTAVLDTIEFKTRFKMRSPQGFAAPHTVFHARKGSGMPLTH